MLNEMVGVLVRSILPKSEVEASEDTIDVATPSIFASADASKLPGASIHPNPMDIWRTDQVSKVTEHFE